MIVKKLKSLLNPPIPSLLLSGVLFVGLAMLSRVSAWGTFAWLIYASYLYFSEVRGKGKMGFSFLFLAIVSFYVLQVVNAGIYLYCAGIFVGALLVLFIGAIGYRMLHHERALYLAQYLLLGMAVAWWVSTALTHPSFIQTIIIALGIYITTRDRNRFVEQSWGKEQAIWYGILTLVALEYLWSISLFSLYVVHTAALFLVFFIVVDDIVSKARSNTISKEYIYKNIGLFALCSVAIGVLAYWF